MVCRRLMLLVGGLAFFGASAEARSESLLDTSLVIDPWGEVPRSTAPTGSWWESASEIVDPWRSTRAQPTPRDELEIIDPWQNRHRRVPTACYPEPR